VGAAGLGDALLGARALVGLPQLVELAHEQVAVGRPGDAVHGLVAAELAEHADVEHAVGVAHLHHAQLVDAVAVHAECGAVGGDRAGVRGGDRAGEPGVAVR
jgi:hypothetical protein